MFESTISTQIFQFGDPSSYHYIVSSNKNGKLDVAYYKDSTTTDSKNNFSINVTPSNYYLAKWYFILFDFTSGSPTTLKIVRPFIDIVTKTSDASSSTPFQMPSGALTFAKSITGKFYELNLSNTYILYFTLPQFNEAVLIIVDSDWNGKRIAYECASDCYDDACYKYSPQVCLSSYLFCTFDENKNCNGCQDGSGRDGSQKCQKCLNGYSMKLNHCNIYLGCLDTNNCVTCSTTSKMCDSCDSTSFLYDNDATSTMCLCKVYLACDNSCKDCNPGPGCYDCFSSVVQVDNTCRVDKVGFQISLEDSNIIIDFAHPLSDALTKSSFKATSSTLVDIPTTGWTLSGCGAGSKQCTIKTSNVFESDLPIDLDILFSKA